MTGADKCTKGEDWFATLDEVRKFVMDKLQAPKPEIHSQSVSEAVSDSDEVGHDSCHARITYNHIVSLAEVRSSHGLGRDYSCPLLSRSVRQRGMNSSLADRLQHTCCTHESVTHASISL